MGKFTTTTQGGQISELDKLAAESAVELPVSPTEETTTSPQTGTGSILEGIPGAPIDAETAGIIDEGITAGLEKEQAIAEQREREFIPDIGTRRDDTGRIDTYFHRSEDKIKAEENASSDGGMMVRAKNMADKVSSGVVSIQGLSTRGQGPVKEIFTNLNVVDPQGSLDHTFLAIASTVTENVIADIAFNEGLEVQPDVVLETEVTPTPNQKNFRPIVTKAQNNTQLGQQLNREWHKYKNRVDGNPQGPIPEISKEQANLLGDVMKELYYETNKKAHGENFLVKHSTPDGNQAGFQITKHGADLLKKGSHKRKRVFPKEHVRPTKTPTPGGQLVGEGRIYSKRVSSKIGKPPAGQDVINQAMSNLNKVANVVDKQRLKILLATALPVLAGEVDPSHPFAALNHVGQDKVNAFAAKAANDPDFDAIKNYAELIDDLAQDIYGVSKEKDGANYLTYYMQGFTGRIAPQQTHFDPTNSKSVRFVTRNAVPSIAKPGSRIERNLRQMYAMMLVPGADKLLPAERDIALERHAGTLVKHGQRLKQLLNGITDAQVNAAAEAIAQGVPINDPSFPKLPSLSLDPQADADLISAIQKKGEDGQAYIDGVIDFANYYQKKLNKQPHASYFNAYMDGKTNGLASNGIQMGSENVAYKTGVIRTQNKLLLDNDTDLRDDLKNELLTSIDEEGFDGALSKFQNSLPSIASKLYGNRDLNKSTTMTFGYGMELSSFKDVIEEHLDVMQQADPELKASVDSILQDDNVTKEQLVETLHTKYVSNLVKVLDPNALKSRSIMKSAAVLHALTNELFTIRSATGLELNFGGSQTTGIEGEGTRYKIHSEGIPKNIKAYEYGQELTAAAAKRRTDKKTGALTLEPGGIATGGSVVGPVQSLDAATVAMTASGRSWAKLKHASGGNPYLHTIYDAFKVDAMGYDVVLEETNKNWLDAGMNWSYLEETKNAVDSLRDTFQEKYGTRPNSSPLTENEWLMGGYLLEPVTNAKGNVYPSNLKRVLSKIMDIPVDADNEKVGEITFQATNKIVKAMSKAGYNYKAKPTPTVGHLKTLIAAINNEVQLADRLNKMIAKTNENKADLKAKIKRDGHKVYQYYSH